MRDLPKTAPFASGNDASRQAARSVYHQLEGIRADVFDLIVSRGTEGATGEEIAETLNILPYTAKPRCTELKDAGYIFAAGLRRNSNGRNETVWVAAAKFPAGPWKAPGVMLADEEEEGPSGLEVFDDVFRRNPHLRNTFRAEEVITIRAALEKAAGLP